MSILLKTCTCLYHKYLKPYLLDGVVFYRRTSCWWLNWLEIKDLGGWNDCQRTLWTALFYLEWPGNSPASGQRAGAGHLFRPVLLFRVFLSPPVSLPLEYLSFARRDNEPVASSTSLWSLKPMQNCTIWSRSWNSTLRKEGGRELFILKS